MPKKQKKPTRRPGSIPRLDSVYSGREDGNETLVVVDGVDLNPRFDIITHSPDGFAWGYGGSGPAQLALAILCDFLGDDEQAIQLYQDFKFEVIARWAQNEPWSIAGQQIAETRTVKANLVRQVHET
ncbi:MAG TPA: DUF6166 domain-containing protein [Methylobacter sp.]|jgi:hypothetical protein